MSTHDALCPSSGNPPWISDCQCALISRIRENERETIANRVMKNCAHTKYVGKSPCFHDMVIATVYRDGLDEL
jgi:hypothetical protein